MSKKTILLSFLPILFFTIDKKIDERLWEKNEEMHAALNSNDLEPLEYDGKVIDPDTTEFTKDYNSLVEHLRELKSMGNLPSELKDQIQDFSKTDFSKSDAWMGRTISSLIKIGWTESQVEARAQKMARLISEAISS